MGFWPSVWGSVRHHFEWRKAPHISSQNLKFPVVLRGIVWNVSTVRRVVLKRPPYRALVKWLWETTHVQEVVGSNPSAIYWMDITFFTLICGKKCIVCLRRPEINKKRPGLDHGPFPKKFRYKFIITLRLLEPMLYTNYSYNQEQGTLRKVSRLSKSLVFLITLVSLTSPDVMGPQ